MTDGDDLSVAMSSATVNDSEEMRNEILCHPVIELNGNPYSPPPTPPPDIASTANQLVIF